MMVVPAVVAALLLAASWVGGQGGQGNGGQGNGGGQGDGSGRIGGKKSRASFITVLDYGATGDGATDDTAAIQALIDLKAGSIRFPAGTYRITKPLVVDLDKVGFTSLVADGTARLVMAGPGPAIRFVGTHGGTAAPDTVKPEVWERQRMPSVEGLAIVGDHAEADGIEAAGTLQLTLRGVHIRKCRHGIHLVERNRNVLIDACHIYENSGCGVFYDHVNLHQTNISASHISYCGGGGVVVRGGDVRNIHIAGCDIEANMAKDGPPTANVLLDCADGSMAEVAITGCTIQHTKDAPDSANIRILGSGFMNRRGEKLPFQLRQRDDRRQRALRRADQHSPRRRPRRDDHRQHVLARLRPQPAGRRLAASRRRREHDGAQPALRLHRRRRATRSIFRGCQRLHDPGAAPAPRDRSEAGLMLEKCDRMHVTGCTILDCDNAGLLVKDTTNSRIAGNLIRDDRPEAKAGVQLVQVTGGSGNVIEIE